MRSVSVAGSVVADMTAYLRLQGVDADAVLRRAGMEPRTSTNAADRIPGHAMAALWREALAASDDPDLGLHAGVAFQPGALDIVGYVMLSSHTAREALRRGARLMRVLNDGLELDIDSVPLVTTCRLRIRDVSDTFLQRDPRQVVETVLVGVVHQLRLLTERPVIARAVTMRHAAPTSGATEHARLFGVAPSFGAAEDTVVLDNRDLDVTLRSANPLLLTAFETHADAALAALDANETLAGRVLREIVKQLKGEAPTMPQVAKALAISPRHLQRGLASEGTTFQSLLDDARRELSVRHLSAPNATVASVAWLVGFSEPSAFHRAFRRWTGHSPRAMAMPAH